MHSEENTPKRSTMEYVPRSFTLGQTIDLLERRQEAAVLRHLRQLNATDSLCNTEVRQAFADHGPAVTANPYTANEFRKLSQAQIVEVMTCEQELLESKVQRLVTARQQSISSTSGI